MSSSLTEVSPGARAEVAFRSAFERLREDKPCRLPIGTKLSQNAVPREAGKDPSALKKDRYPSLIREIQEWIARDTQVVAPSPRQMLLASRRKNRQSVELIGELKGQRDSALSQLLSVQIELLELWQRVQMLEAVRNSSVVVLKRPSDELEKQGQEKLP